MGCAPLLHLPLLPLGGVDTADLSCRSPEWGNGSRPQPGRQCLTRGLAHLLMELNFPLSSGCTEGPCGPGLTC